LKERVPSSLAPLLELITERLILTGILKGVGSAENLY
jgi:hypothetical protein